MNTHSVYQSYDGCIDEYPLFTGSRAECLTFMKRNWRRYNKGKGSLDLKCNSSGRLCSFVLEDLE